MASKPYDDDDYEEHEDEDRDGRVVVMVVVDVLELNGGSLQRAATAAVVGDSRVFCGCHGLTGSGARHWQSGHGRRRG